MSCQVPVAPAPPALKDLPKVAGDLKSELEGFKTDKLKNADTQEKIVLPSAEGIYTFLYLFSDIHRQCCIKHYGVNDDRN